MFRFTRVLQFNIETRDGYCLEGIRGEDVVRLAEEVNANTIAIFARDAWGRSFYDSRVSRKHGKLGGRDFVGEVVREARRRGLNVVLMIGHTSNLELYEKHPEWCQRDPDGRVISMDSDPDNSPRASPDWPLMCLNSPFVDHVKEEASEALSYGVDGVFLDSFRYMPDWDRACYCDWCRRRYEREAGGSLEPREDPAQFEWRVRVNVEKLAEIHEHVRTLSKGSILVYNVHPMGWRGRACSVAERARDYMDVAFAECSETDYQPPGFIAEMTKLVRALTKKPVWASRNSFHTTLTSSQTTGVVIRQGIREAFAGGGWPLYLVFSSSHKAGHETGPAREAMNEVRRLEEYMLGADYLSYVGVVYSNRSRDASGPHVSKHITDSFRGFYYALLEEGLPVNYVSDASLDANDFLNYKALVLANTVSLSRRAEENIASYVRRGGGLVATYKTGFLDERGRERSQPSTTRLLGLRLLGLVRSEWAYLRASRIRHPVLKGLGGSLLLWGDFDREFYTRRTPPELGWHLRVEPGGGLVLATIHPSTEAYGWEYENGRSPPPPRLEGGSPGLLVNDRLVYFPGQAGRLYWRTGDPRLRRLIVNTVLWSAGEPLVRVSSGGYVELEAYKRDNQLLIHLLNHTYDRRLVVRSNRALDRMLASTPEPVWPPTRVAPLANVRLVLARGSEVRRAYSPLREGGLKVVKRRGHQEVVVKRLGEYHFIVVELD